MSTVCLPSTSTEDTWIKRSWISTIYFWSRRWIHFSRHNSGNTFQCDVPFWSGHRRTTRLGTVKPIRSFVSFTRFCRPWKNRMARIPSIIQQRSMKWTAARYSSEIKWIFLVILLELPIGRRSIIWNATLIRPVCSPNACSGKIPTMDSINNRSISTSPENTPPSSLCNRKWQPWRISKPWRWTSHVAAAVASLETHFSLVLFWFLFELLEQINKNWLNEEWTHFPVRSRCSEKSTREIYTWLIEIFFNGHESQQRYVNKQKSCPEHE